MMAANNNSVLHGHQDRYLLYPNILRFYFFTKLDQVEEFAKKYHGVCKVNSNKTLYSIYTQYLVR